MKGSPEFTALQNICQYFLGTKALPEKVGEQFTGINWQKFSGLLHQHKLHALVWQFHQKHPQILPKGLRQQLQGLANWQKKRKLTLVTSTLAIQKAHQVAGIPILPYKGIALGQQFYGDIFMRNSNDIDFALEKKYLVASAKIMQELGFEELKETSNFEKLEDSRSYHIDYSWVKYDAQGNILCNAEIHWQPANSALFTNYQFKDLVQQQHELSIFNKSIAVFNKVHHALLIIIHHGLVDTWTQLRHLVDLVLILKTMNATEIKVLESLLVESKVKRCYDYGIYLAKTILNYQHPTIEISTKKLAIHQQLKDKIIASELVGKWSENRMKLYYYLRMRDSFADQLKSVYYFLKFALFDFRYKIKKHD